MIWRTLPLICALALAPCAAPQNTVSARPGAVNYTEGRVSIGDTALASKPGRTTELEPGQSLTTGEGKAEMLLTPGVFLRLGDHSSVKMLSDSLTDTRLELENGQALLDVTELYKENHIVIVDGGTSTTLLSRGLYGFEAGAPSLSVFDGKAQVAGNDSTITVKKGHRLALAAVPLKPQKFDRNTEDPLYAWSKLRSAYIAEASEASARTVVQNGYVWTPGWYWNPFWGTWALLPGSGFLYSPFGFGFYSPRIIYNVPVYPGGPFYTGPHAWRPPGIRRPLFRAPGAIARPVTSGVAHRR